VSGSRARQKSHGWWPYLAPYLSFIGLAEIGGRLPEAAWLPLLAIKPAVPVALMLYFASQGAYPELRGFARKAAGVPLDIAVGFASALLWMAPYVAIPALRPDLDSAFDPARAGAEFAGLALGLRAIGYALVTPFFEELFIRSFVIRYADVYAKAKSFSEVPMARYSLPGFLVSTAIFTIGHVPWEWWVCVPWVMGTTLYFYWRGHLGAVIVVHAVANVTILLAAMFASDRFPDGQGGVLPLWFFV
jgi:CAAX prenyl protease-like protein